MPVLRATALTVRWGNVDTLGCHRIGGLSLRRVVRHDVCSHAVPVALVGKCSIPAV